MTNKINGINQQTFNQLLEAGLTEEEIKQKIGDLSIPWKGDTVQPIKTATEEQKLVLYDKLRVSDLPFDWELRLERLKALDKEKDQYLKTSGELKTWTDAFPNLKPNEVQEKINQLEKDKKDIETRLNAKITELENKLTNANNQGQQDLNEKDKKIKELEDKLKGVVEAVDGKSDNIDNNWIIRLKEEYNKLKTRPDIPITSKEFWDDYVLRLTKEKSDGLEKDLNESRNQADQYWKEKQAIWRGLEKWASDEILRQYILAKPTVNKEQAETAIKELLTNVESRWSDYLEKNIITPQNMSLFLRLTYDNSKRNKAEKVLDWIREVKNKQMDYQQLFNKWTGSSYNKENDLDGGSLYFFTNYLEKYLEIKNFGTPKIAEIEVS